MKQVVRDAAVALFEGPGPGPRKQVLFLAQTVEIHRPGPQAIIGIDGHTSRWNELVEVRWEGSHLADLAGVAQVEVKNQGRDVFGTLPMEPHRRPYEADGDTVFFLCDEE